MTRDELFGAQWILAYEASVKGWLPTFKKGDHIAETPQFEYLRQQSVSFFDPNAPLKSRYQYPEAKKEPSPDDFEVIPEEEDEEEDLVSDVSG